MSNDDFFTPSPNQDTNKAPSAIVAQAQEILGEILTNVLDASAQLDLEYPNWRTIAEHSNNIKTLQIQLQSL